MTGNEINAFSEFEKIPAPICHPATVAVIIPTKDRPEFLEEAICSALQQSHAPIEIIIVDDGSTIPVDGVRLRERHGPTVQVLRNEKSRGLAYSRNRGVERATAEYVIHLDDDDLLTVDAIEQCYTVFRDFPEVDIIMFAAEGFGPNSEHFNRVQPEGVKEIIRVGKGNEVRPNVVLFGRDLFTALLRKVPIAFQRVMLRKVSWCSVCQLRWDVYCLDPSVPDEATAKVSIGGPLRDSEWAQYASLVCQRIALVNHPLYLQRCAGQGYSSQPANRQLHMHQGLEILGHLAQGAEKVPALTKWKFEIRKALARAYFDAAYQHHHSGDQSGAWQFLKQTMSIRMKPKYLKLAVRIWLEHCVVAIRTKFKLK